MTLSTNNPVCSALRRQGEISADSPELFFVYGGLRSDEIEWLLESRHAGSRVFWITQGEEELTGLLVEAVSEGRLAVVSVDGKVDECFYSFFNPKERLDYVLLNAERLSQAHVSRCEAVLLALREQIRLCVFNAGTLVTKGPLWQSNTLQNFPVILRSPGTGVLHGAFEGRPAVVVGAGPSLTRVIPHLVRARDRFVVISTGTALAPLRDAGVRPDLVIAVDGSHLIRPQFDCRHDDLYLVGSTLVYSGITRGFKGNFFGLLDLSPIDQWVKSVSEAGGKLYAGGTVTACGMDLASSMGCNPVFTVGLDLSFPRAGASHACGTMYKDKPQASVLIPVAGNYEDEVYTTRQFACYIELIKRLVESRSKTRFVNVTDGGALIEGLELAELSTLSEWEGPCFDAYAEIEALYCPPDEAVLRRAYEELLEISGYLEEVQTGCRNGAMAANRLYLMERRPDRADREEMRQCLDVIHDLDRMFDEGRKQCSFLQMSLWPAAYELAGKNLNRPDGADANRMRRFYEQIAGAAKWTRHLVVRACAELESSSDNSDSEQKNITGENYG